MVGAAGEACSEKRWEQGRFLTASGLPNFSPRFVLRVNRNQPDALGPTARGYALAARPAQLLSVLSCPWVWPQRGEHVVAQCCSRPCEHLRTRSSSGGEALVLCALMATEGAGVVLSLHRVGGFCAGPSDSEGKESGCFKLSFSFIFPESEAGGHRGPF